MKFNFTIYCLLIFLPSFSQINNNQEKIKTIIENYFQYERENIHVQFNKTTYLNNEDIAFKGYVINKNKSLPDINTSNVQLVIYNDQQKIVQKQLLYTSLGCFEGGIHLNEKFTTGKYYFQFYTNWMNNFMEDESFTQTVEIINKNEPYHLNSNEPNWETAKLSVFPEGGVIINGINNRIGIRITDCDKKGIEIKGSIVLDSNSKEITRFSTNKMGNGSFYFFPKLNEIYSVKVKSEKLNLTQLLPKAQNTGIIISYNNNLPKNILAVVLKTNDIGIELYQGKKFNFIIHQNGNLIQHEFSFDNKEPEQMVSFDKSNLANGINTMRVIDENLNEVTERLVYINTATRPNTTLETKTIPNDSISLTADTNLKNANLSISILPKNNIAIAPRKSNLGTFYLNSYLAQPEEETYAYFDTENKNRNQDIELLLLNQNQNKYLWNAIKSQPAKITYPFAQGITISGKVEKKLNPNSKYKISLISLKNKIFEETTVDANNEYKFENIFVQDSTAFFLQMLNEKNVTLFTTMTTNVSTHDSSYTLPLNLDKTVCPTLKKSGEIFTFSNSDKNTINLNNITIKNNYKKDKLIHKEDNSFAKAYKINEKEFGTLLDFLNRNGYQTGINASDNSVYIKNRQSDIVRNSDASPDVFIDDVTVLDLNLLYNYNINEVDEIYIDKIGSSGFTTGGNGIIKIYLKGGVKKDFWKTKLTSFILTKGFTKNIQYKNSLFETQKELDYFGTLNWTPSVITQENSNFEIKFPKGNQQEISVHLEGFSNDGQLISEIKTITIPSNQ